MNMIRHQRPPFLVTIRLEQLYCNKKGAFFGITFDAHPHSGWFICLERFAFSTGLIALQKNQTGNHKDCRFFRVLLAMQPTTPQAILTSIYSITSVTTPEPTVLPPSRIANLSPSSIAIGVISFTSMMMLSPGMHISVPSGS